MVGEAGSGARGSSGLFGPDCAGVVSVTFWCLISLAFLQWEQVSQGFSVRVFWCWEARLWLIVKVLR